MPAVFDTESLQRQVKLGKREKQRQIDAKQLEELLANSVLLDKMPQDPTKAINQLGSVMLSSEFEARIKKLCPSLSFIDNHYRQDKRAIGYYDSSGWHTLVVYEKGYMPERSILRSQEELVPDMSYEMQNRRLNRLDMPKGEFVPGKGWIYPEGTILPGWKKVRHPYGEAVRGWRTVLLRLIHLRQTTPDAVERLFGSDNTAQWAAHTGKQNITVRW